MTNGTAHWFAWKWDWWTLGWVVWMAWFVALETWTLAAHSHNELTAHLRPVFQSNPLLWFLALGVIMWLIYHFLVQGIWVPVEQPPIDK